MSVINETAKEENNYSKNSKTSNQKSPEVKGEYGDILPTHDNVNKSISKSQTSSKKNKKDATDYIESIIDGFEHADNKMSNFN
jgi:hypothetical protein